MLEIKGICASSGSACTSGSLNPSHVLLAIGLPHEIKCTWDLLRQLLPVPVHQEEIEYVLETLAPIILESKKYVTFN